MLSVESAAAFHPRQRVIHDHELARNRQIDVHRSGTPRRDAVFVHAGQMGHGIGRVMLDPFSLLLVSSKAEDFEAVRAYRESGLSVEQAIEAVLRDRGLPGYGQNLSKAA